MLLAIIIAGILGTPQEPVRVSNYGDLRKALTNARPGAVVLLEPGEYSGGFQIENVRGTASRPIIVGAADLKNPPTIVRGGMHFVAPAYLEIRDLQIFGPAMKGINIDDGGVRERPAHHVTLRNLKVSECIQEGANGLKLAGVDDFKIIGCEVRNWGDCAIDFVGCHDGLVEKCHFQNGRDIGVQIKGSSARVKVLNNRFVDYGGRGVNIGGSTGVPYYRPPLESQQAGARHEAKDITVSGNVFQGGDAPVAFVGVDGAIVVSNTIFMPNKWSLRILQETSTLDFVPSRNGRFERNIVVFRSDRWFEGGVNIGPKTAPDTFRFEGNFWLCQDRPDRSEPRLPTSEKQGHYGKDPMFVDPSKGDFNLKAGSPAAGLGAFSGQFR